MLTRQQAIDVCLRLPGAYEDYPFEDPNWTIMRHRGNRKMFAAIYARQGHIWLNLKADPMWGDLWKQNWPAVIPAYHMNKQHWISVILDGSMTQEEVVRLICDSHALTAPKIKAKRQ